MIGTILFGFILLAVIVAIAWLDSGPLLRSREFRRLDSIQRGKRAQEQEYQAKCCGGSCHD